MRVKILGSAAGGGFPQWNCACANCRSLREGKLKSQARTQSQVALSFDSKSWFLLNASPDLRTQIEAHLELQPREPQRHTPIVGVILTNADLDHVLGLLLLREFQSYHVYCTRSVRKVLQEDNSFFQVLNQSDIRWLELTPGTAFPLAETSCLPLTAGKKFPRYVTEARAKELQSEEATLGLQISLPTGLQTGSSRKALFYLPGIATLDAAWLDRLQSAEPGSVLLLDGTFWANDELIKIRGAGRTAIEMGHLPVSESLAMLSSFKNLRKIFVHINNTNPILDEESREHRQAVELGWEIPRDGLEVIL